jgi:chitin synthase
VLASLHPSTPSLMIPFIRALPINTPQSLYTALSVIRSFTSTVTPQNASYSRYSSLAATLTITLAGELTAASLALSTTGIDTQKGLLSIPPESGFRAFDVFYYLLTAASTPAEREFLGLKAPSSYHLLNKSQTYDPPSYLPSADDGAAADDFRSSLKSLGIKGANHRYLLSILAGLLKLGDTIEYTIDGDELDEVCEEVGGLLGAIGNLRMLGRLDYLKGK